MIEDNLRCSTLIAKQRCPALMFGLWNFVRWTCMRQIAQSTPLEFEVKYLSRYVGQIFFVCDKVDELVIVHAAIDLGDPLPFRHRICLHGEKYNRVLKL